MLNLAFDRDQMYDKSTCTRYFIPPLTCVKDGVKVNFD